MHDSAGVTIVSIPRVALMEPATSQMDSTPVLSIGSAGGADTELFGRISGIVSLSDGRTAIADGKAAEIRVFDSTGRWLRTIGRHGGGPGEFVNLYSLFPDRGDSILVFDHEGQRAHRMDREGNTARTFRIQVADTGNRNLKSPRVIGAFRDGTLATRHFTGACGRFRDPIGNTTFCEDSAHFLRIGEDGSILAEFGKLATIRTASVKLASGGSLRITSLLPQGHFAVNDSFFVHADGIRPEIRIHSITGELRRVLKLDLPARLPVDNASSNSVPPNISFGITMDARMDDAGTQAEIAAAISTMVATAGERFLESMFVDRAGNIWVQPSPQGSDLNVRRHWLVFNIHGELLRKVEMPFRVDGRSLDLDIATFSGNTVVASTFDSIGAPVVRFWQLREKR
jgi:hypothetical protein